MPFIKDETEETKNRIILTAERHFSDKGFDASRIDEIAKEAGVNKALIYYYFKNKEAILDHLINTLFDDMMSIGMNFVKTCIVGMIKKGLLDIQEDRWCFVSEDAAQEFRDDTKNYFTKLVDFMLLRRKVVRILIFESLKNGKHHNGLFRMLDVFEDKSDDSFFKTIWNADHDFSYTENIVVSKFFFGLIPMLNFAAYFDDYLAAGSLTEAELRNSFLRAYEKLSTFYINGKELIY